MGSAVLRLPVSHLRLAGRVPPGAGADTRPQCRLLSRGCPSATLEGVKGPWAVRSFYPFGPPAPLAATCCFCAASSFFVPSSGLRPAARSFKASDIRLNQNCAPSEVASAVSSQPSSLLSQPLKSAPVQSLL